MINLLLKVKCYGLSFEYEKIQKLIGTFLHYLNDSIFEDLI